MGRFVATENRNGCRSIARENQVAGAVIHPCASCGTIRSTLGDAKRLRFGQRHKVLDDLTINIRMIEPRRRFEVGHVARDIDARC